MSVNRTVTLSAYATMSLTYKFPGDGVIEDFENVPEAKAVGDLVLRNLGRNNGSTYYSNATNAISEQGSISACNSYLGTCKAKKSIDLDKCFVIYNSTIGSFSFSAVNSILSSFVTAEMNIALKNSLVHRSCSLKSINGSIVWENDEKNHWWINEDKQPSDFICASEMQARSNITLRNANLSKSIVSERGEIKATLVNRKVPTTSCTVRANKDITVNDSFLLSLISETGKIKAENSQISSIQSSGDCELIDVIDNLFAAALSGKLTISSLTKDKNLRIPFSYLTASESINISHVESIPNPKAESMYRDGSVICTNGPVIAENCNLLNVKTVAYIKLVDTKIRLLAIDVSLEGVIELDLESEICDIRVRKVDLAAKNAFIIYNGNNDEIDDELSKDEASAQKVKAEKIAELAAEEESLAEEAEQYPVGSQGLINGIPHKIEEGNDKKRKFVKVKGFPKDTVKLIIKGKGKITGTVTFSECNGRFAPDGQTCKVEQTSRQKQPRIALAASQAHVTTNVTIHNRPT